MSSFMKRAASMPACAGQPVAAAAIVPSVTIREERVICTVPRVASSVFEMELEPVQQQPQQQPGRQLGQGGGMGDRCQSALDLQQGTLPPSDFLADISTPMLHLRQLCRPANEFERGLFAFLDKVWRSGGAAASDGPAAAEALAAAMRAAGYLVHIREGSSSSQAAAPTASASECLKSLKHRFVVCVGYHDGVPGSRGAAAQHTLARAGSGLAALPGAQHASSVMGAFDGTQQLEEPLVVELRFRDQFHVANPSPTYVAALQAVPTCFVGTLVRLDGAVSILADELAQTFHQQRMPLPPWRTREAVLSKWCPQQLEELASKMKAMAAAGRALDAAITSAAVAQRGCGSAGGPITLLAKQLLAEDALPSAAAGSACVMQLGELLPPPPLTSVLHSNGSSSSSTEWTGAAGKWAADEVPDLTPVAHMLPLAAPGGNGHSQPAFQPMDVGSMGDVRLVFSSLVTAPARTQKKARSLLAAALQSAAAAGAQGVGCMDTTPFAFPGLQS